MADTNADAFDPLALWLALELRRARAAFDRSRRAWDADIVAKAGRLSGPRVKLILTLASEICVSLADETIAKAVELRSSLHSFSKAKAKVQAFTQEVTRSAIPLAYITSQGSRSAVAAATERGAQLCKDIEGAFVLAEPKLMASQITAVRSTAAAERECSAWLLSQFKADPEKKRTKSDFQTDALNHFSKRLSKRGFLRAWDGVAEEAGRSQPGRKS